MVNFRFIHAADLHLDSPLIGLAKKSEDCAARRDDASRRAFDNLVGLAIEEDCRLIVVAIDELGAVIHGRSYPQRDVVDNIAIEYPSPVPGRFNIGLLHTACGGSEGHLPAMRPARSRSSSIMAINIGPWVTSTSGKN